MAAERRRRALCALVCAGSLALAGASSSALLLVGIALNALLGAVISAAIANAVDAEDARSAMFWLNGDLTGRSIADVGMALLPVLLGTAGVLLHARELNLLALGDAAAQTSGLEVARTKHLVLAAAALATAALVFHGDVGSGVTFWIAAALLAVATVVVLTVVAFTARALAQRRLFAE